MCGVVLKMLNIPGDRNHLKFPGTATAFWQSVSLHIHLFLCTFLLLHLHFSFIPLWYHKHKHKHIYGYQMSCTCLRARVVKLKQGTIRVWRLIVIDMHCSFSFSPESYILIQLNLFILFFSVFNFSPSWAERVHSHIPNVFPRVSSFTPCVKINFSTEQILQ